MKRLLWILLCSVAFAQGGITISPGVTVSPKVSAVPAQTHATTTLDGSCAQHNAASPVNCLPVIASFTGTSGTLTFTAPNSLISGNSVALSGFTSGNVGLNGQIVTVLSAGLTSSTFEATVTGSGYSSGTGNYNMVVSGGDSIACTADQFSFGTIGGYLSDNLNGPYNAVSQGLFNSDTGHWQSHWILCNSQAGSVTPVMTTFGSTSGLDITCAAFKGTLAASPPNGCVDPATIHFSPPNGVGITGTNPQLESYSITSFTGTSGTLTFSATNDLTVGTSLTLSAFTAGNAGLNGQVVTVLPAGLTGSAFEATVTGSGFSSGTGTASSAFTPAQGKEAIYAGMGNIGPTTPTAGSGFTLLTGATQGIALWPEYSIQTSATSTPCGYTATSDTWFDGCFGIVNAGASGGAILPFSGFVIDGHGNTNGTTITAGNALSASYNSIATAYTVQNISTMQWVTGGPCPPRISTIYVNGVGIAGNTGVSLQHTANIAGENLKVQMNLNPSGFMEEFYCISQSGFTPGVTSQYCDVSSIASTPTGDDSTPQFLYEIPSLTAAANASGGNTVYTANQTQLTLTSVAATTTGSANNGQAVYTGTITGGGSNAFMGKQFLIAGFTNPGNNGTYIVLASTTTTLTALNLNAVAETHAATATTGNLGDSTGQGAVSGNNWLAGASVTIAGFVTGANNGTFTVVSSTPSTVTVNNPSGVAETHAATLAVGYVFRMEITNTTTTILSPGVRLPNGTGPFLVDILGDVTNSGVHTLKILNATTGALIGTDTIPVTGLAAGNGGANTLVANFGNQGSCGTGTNVFQYSNMGGSANGVGYPWPE